MKPITSFIICFLIYIIGIITSYVISLLMKWSGCPQLLCVLTYAFLVIYTFVNCSITFDEMTKDYQKWYFQCYSVVIWLKGETQKVSWKSIRWSKLTDLSYNWKQRNLKIRILNIFKWSIQKFSSYHRRRL